MKWMFQGRTSRTGAPGKSSRMPGLDLPYELPELRDPRRMRWFVYLATFATLLAGLWAYKSPISEVVTGQGKIVTTASITRVEHPFGGRVTSVLASTGDYIEAGEKLVLLDTDSMTRERATLLARKARLHAEEQRAAFIMAGNTADVFPAPQQQSQEERLFWAEQEFLASQIGLIAAEAESMRNQIVSLGNKKRSLQTEASLASKHAERLSRLAERGSVRRIEAEVAERDRLRVEQELHDVDANLIAAADALRRTDLKRQELMTARFRDAAARQTELSEMVTTIDQELGELDARLEQSEITAPISGRIQALPVSGPGDVILRGELIAEIVQIDSPVQAEIQISADRIGDVEAGMEVRIKVATFDFAWFGTVMGTVDSVSPTSAENDRGESVYTVVVSLPEGGKNLKISGQALRPGMTITADILGETKTVLAYLMKPLRSLQSRAFTES